MASRAPGEPNLDPADSALNLPVELNSHGLRRLVATESVHGSFEATAQAAERATWARIGKRQVEALTQAAAVDIEAFYTARRPPGWPVMSLDNAANPEVSHQGASRRCCSTPDTRPSSTAAATAPPGTARPVRMGHRLDHRDHGLPGRPRAGGFGGPVRAAAGAPAAVPCRSPGGLP